MKPWISAFSAAILFTTIPSYAISCFDMRGTVTINSPTGILGSIQTEQLILDEGGTTYLYSDYIDYKFSPSTGEFVQRYYGATNIYNLMTWKKAVYQGCHLVIDPRDSAPYRLGRRLEDLQAHIKYLIEKGTKGHGFDKNAQTLTSCALERLEAMSKKCNYMFLVN